MLREAVSHTKYCYSLKVNTFGPSQNFGLVTPLIRLTLPCITFLQKQHQDKIFLHFANDCMV